jgi:hypothetical protein
MEPPPKYKKFGGSENLKEWLSKHTFSEWRLVDLDNWLVGNPLVIPKLDPRKKTATDRSPTDMFSKAMNQQNFS